jgi:hypothetical protein
LACFDNKNKTFWNYSPAFGAFGCWKMPRRWKEKGDNLEGLNASQICGLLFDGIEVSYSTQKFYKNNFMGNIELGVLNALKRILNASKERIYYLKSKDSKDEQVSGAISLLL